MSALQDYTFRKLFNTVPHLTIRENYRPVWLEHNGGRLELDFYIEEMRFAIEVQGIQHFEYTKHFHKTPEGFKAQQKRDEAKRIICTIEGVRFIEIQTELDVDILAYELADPNTRQKHLTILQERDNFLTNKRRSLRYEVDKQLTSMNRLLGIYRRRGLTNKDEKVHRLIGKKHWILKQHDKDVMSIFADLERYYYQNVT